MGIAFNNDAHTAPHTCSLGKTSAAQRLRLRMHHQGVDAKSKVRVKGNGGELTGLRGRGQ